MDEVGRGALAGPVSVGAVMIQANEISKTPPAGLADSKALSPKRREELIERIKSWVYSHAVGHANAQEVDDVGIIGALGLAGHRALSQIRESSRQLSPEASAIIILDGNFDWLTPLAPDDALPPVQLVTKGDELSATIAAASIIAKVTRDALMTSLHLEHPEYEWAANKGYASAVHQESIRRLGPTKYHRVSWRLPQ